MDTGEVGIDNIVAAVAAGALWPFLGGISEADDDCICQNLQWQSLLAPTFKNENILASQNLHALGRVLKEAEIEIDESAPSGAATGGGGTGGTGSWRPQPHFVWDIIFDAYFPQTSAPGLAGKVSFQEFFRVVVDGQSDLSNQSRLDY